MRPRSDALTRTGTLTAEGVIVGTLQYMAPEQLEGKPTDARSDLFAFGAILYEMVTGRRAFDAPSQAGIVGAILHAEVPPVASAPPAFARVLTACLAKKPEDRWSSAHDVRLLLSGIGAEAHSGVVAMPPPVARRGHRAGWIVAALALAAMACFVARTTWRPAGASTRRAVDRAAHRHDASRGARPRKSRRMDATSRLSRPTRAGRTLLYLRAAIVRRRAPAGGH